jgi:hypothetical protein
VTVWPNGSTKQPHISSFYGPRKSPGGIGTKIHKGIDIPLPLGAPLVSPQSGTVRVAQYLGGWGNHVAIQHAFGQISTASHMRAIEVRVGQVVSEGQVIGHVGMTGNTTGPHVHSEIKVNGTYTDPLPWYQARVSPTQQTGGGTVQPGGGTPDNNQEEDDMFTAEDRKMLQELRGKAPTIESANKRAGDAATRSEESLVKLAEIAESLRLIVHELPGIRQTHTRSGDAATFSREGATIGRKILDMLAAAPGFDFSSEDAAEIADLVLVNLGEKIPTFTGFTDEDVTRFAKAAADERDARERARLG